MKHFAAILVFLSSGALYAADLPPHARAAGGGWYECERGYLMRGNACVSEEQAALEPNVIVSSLPSAGDGSHQKSAASPRVVYIDSHVGPYSRYGGPYPDRVYDRVQSTLSLGARVVPFTLGW